MCGWSAGNGEGVCVDGVQVMGRGCVCVDGVQVIGRVCDSGYGGKGANYTGWLDGH